MIPRSRNLLATGLAATLAVTLPRSYATDRYSSTKPAKAELPQLQLTVHVPTHWRPFLADDLAEAFASRVADVLRRQGFTSEVEFVSSGESDQSMPPVLALRLINWRISRTGNAECTFSAAILAGGKEESLGVFENTHPAWNSGIGRRGMAETLGDAADGALRDLAAKLAQSGSVPGFPAAVNKAM
jgi:hypothetical protein